MLTKLLNRIKTDESQSAGELLWWNCEAHVSELMTSIGDAEAIAGTPVPLSYSRHTSRLLSIWTILSPVVFVQCLPSLLVPLVTLIVSWVLLATEEIGHIIEEPFGLHDYRPNILPLRRYCDIISKDISEITSDILRQQVSRFSTLPSLSSPLSPPPPPPLLPLMQYQRAQPSILNSQNHQGD